MKAFLLLATLLVAALAAEDKYTNKYDNIDLDEILRSERLLKNYFNCLLDKGPCTPEGTELKKNIPDALVNGCTKCNEQQRQGADKVIRYLVDKKPEFFKELEKKYDPEGTYKKKYAKEIEEFGIKL